ncbi:hypothetical protein PHYBOEH_008603 [Phytophthora boehmeriae]|uniref:RxLR effector protein n=1 Tax=Phytophthora boehmeriae TaxID=109152 RepID=A0A8T1W3J9_9STRA|nr:hypothetical protein PHYBOEH_008603 [Phytophthora boehmeriae]
MRLLCYVLLLLAVLFVTNSEATSAVKSSKQDDVAELTESDIIALTRFVTADNGVKRQLRGAADTDGADLAADDEERAIKVPASVTKLLNTLSTKAIKLKESAYNGAFKALFKLKVTPDGLAKRFPASIRAKLKSFFEKYATYYNTQRLAIVPFRGT